MRTNVRAKERFVLSLRFDRACRRAYHARVVMALKGFQPPRRRVGKTGGKEGTVPGS